MRKPLKDTNKTYATLNALLGSLPEFRPAPVRSDVAGVILACWEAGLITTDELAWEVLRIVEHDVADGFVPWDVSCFGQLHDFVDANMYTDELIGLAEPDDEDDERHIAIHNAVTSRVNELLTGSKETPAYYADGFPWQEMQERGKSRDTDMAVYLVSMGRR
jgi:hypothetical protein